MNTNNFKEKYGPWAVVTGASSGIGRALAKELVKKGLNVILVGRSVSALDDFSAELRSMNNQVDTRVLVTDLADEHSVDSIVGFAKEFDVGLLIASAGFGSSGVFLENPLDSELEMLAVNCRSVLELSWHFGNRFRQRGRGGMILLSSIVSFQGTPWSSHYSASKAYVQNLAEGLRAELRPRNVDVLSAAPGPTKTGFAARAGLKMGNALDPNAIAPEILASLGRRTTVLPGILSKLLVYSLAPLPRWCRIHIMGNVMNSMSRN